MDEETEIIVHPTTPGNTLFAEMKKCDFCPCYFFTSHDLNRHLDTFGRRLHSRMTEADYELLQWRKSNFDDSEICPSKADPVLKMKIKQNGFVERGGCTITLSNNEEWFKKRVRNV